jgi:hypothetical protein
MWSARAEAFGLAERDDCPDPHCARSRDLQWGLAPEEMACVGVTEDWAGEAMRCGACGCVYTGAKGRPFSRGYFYPTLGIWLPAAAARSHAH